MFDKAKQLHKIKKMQSDVQKQLESITHVEEKGDIRVIVRANKKIEEISIDGEDRKDLKNLLNEAFKNVDKKAEKKMRSQAPELMSMFGM